MKHTLLLVSAALSSLLVVSCSKEKVETKEGSSNVTYRLSTTERNSTLGRFASTTARIQSGDIIWTGGSAAVSEIKFEAKGDNKVEYKSNVPQRFNLFDSVATLGGIAVPAATYEKIEFKIKFDPTTSLSAFELKGHYLNGSDSTPIVLQINQPMELKFEKKTPTTIDATTNYNALSTLALALLTTNISESMLTSATKDSNGSIVISANSNANLYNPIWNTLQGLLKVEIKKD